MDKYALHKIWSPDGASWSPWVKAILFSHLPRPLPALPPVDLMKEVQDMAWLPSGTAGVALVVDLPGEESIRIGVELARRGFQPVPIFSSCPPAHGLPSTVDAEVILATLVEAGQSLSGLSAPPSASPAFLIDARRMGRGHVIEGEIFDNRSAVFASDFPTAATLRAHGVSRCFILRDDAVPLLGDLPHALFHWKIDGLDIRAMHLDGSAAAWKWPPRGWVFSMLNRLRLLWLQRNPDGGFGRVISEASGG